MRELMKDVHLSNHAENMLFFSPEPGQNANFRDLYYQARYAYGDDVVKSVVDPDRLINRSHLEQIEKDGLFKGQAVEIKPVKTTGTALEAPIVLDIRFVFEPNKTTLELGDETNKQALKDLAKLLKWAPGSYFHLVGHMDTSNVDAFKAKGPEFYRKNAVRAVEESKKRSEAVKEVLLSQYKVDKERITTEGKGWDQPIPGAKPEENRRVEVQFFQLE
jgi:NitT/TauT family transport system substrate-binding protein